MSNISRLIIEQQVARIGIETTNAQLSIHTPRPQMAIESVPAQMSIDRENPSFEVDWEAVRAESGLRSPVNLSKYVRDTSRNKAMQSIGQSARDGDFLGDVTQPGNRVAQLAKSKTKNRTQTEINLGLMPKHRPNIQWNPGHVNVSWSRHRLIVEWDTEFMPVFVVDPPYSVEIFLTQQPYIRVSIAEGEASPYEPGKAVDIAL